MRDEQLSAPLFLENFPNQIALLLPMSGEYQREGESILYGFLSAHYSLNQNNIGAKKIKIYDTQKFLTSEIAYSQAVNEGADFVVGPLLPNSVKELSNRIAFNVPILRVRNITFSNPKEKLLELETSEQIILSQSLGHLSCKLLSVSKNQLWGYSPSFGDFKLSLSTIRQIKCNQHLLRRNKYLDGLNEVKKALDMQRPELAISNLESLPFAQRSWYWHRLSFLARSMLSEEILSFTPHPNKNLASASFAGNADTILSTSKQGEYALWSGHAKLASGSFSNHDKTPIEIGRFLNEEQYSVNLSHPYWLSETEVTEAQFKAVTSHMLGPEKNGSLPIVCNWFEAQKFCNKNCNLQAIREFTCVLKLRFALQAS